MVTDPPVTVSTLVRWSRMSLVNMANGPSLSRSTTDILDCVKRELSGYGANEFSPFLDNSFTFTRRPLSWGRTWMGQLSGGEVHVAQTGEGMSLSVEARFGRLLFGHACFAGFCAVVGLPLVINAGMNLIVMVGNMSIAQFSLRRMVGRVVGDRPA